MTTNDRDQTSTCQVLADGKKIPGLAGPDDKRGFSEIIIEGLNRCKMGLEKNLDMDSIQTDDGYKPWLLPGTGTHVRKAGLPNHNLPLLFSKDTAQHLTVHNDHNMSRAAGRHNQDRISVRLLAHTKDMHH